MNSRENRMLIKLTNGPIADSKTNRLPPGAGRRLFIPSVLTVCSLLLLAPPAGVAMTPPGNALSFNGTSSSVNCGAGATLDLTGALTIEAWIKPTSANSLRTIVGHKNGGSANGGYGFFVNTFNNTDAKLQFETKSAAITTSAAAITWGVWQHVAVSWNGTVAHIYVNGIEQAVTGNVNLTSSAVNGFLGSLSDGGYYYSGSMDEVRIWNVARTQADIQDAMHHVLTGSETGLKAYYQFDQSSGTTLPDLTANANTGTLVNSPAWVASTFPCANTIASRNNLRGVWDAHTTSLPSSRCTVANATVTAPAFAVLGHDNGADAWQTADVPSGIAQRLTRGWQAEVSGSVTGDIRIDTTGLSDIGDSSRLRLLVDTDGTFASGTTVLPGNFSNPTFTVSGQTLSSGDYYTLALCQQPFTELNPGFRGAGWYARAAWGDYDNDGDLDLFLAGYDDGATPKAAARIYRNNGDGTFTDLNAGLPNVEFGTWGDFDRDGDLDLAVSGLDYETNTRVTEIYRNDNGSFVSINAGLTPVEYAELAWGDYDNDGDLDLVVAGDDATGAQRTTLYRNDGGVFVDANAGLLGVDSASLAWGDYDNDGDLDLALSGYTGPGESRARLYRNDGGAFVAMDAGLVQAGDGTVAWGDYDNDGDLDLLVSGSVGGATDATRLYRNNGNGTFTENAVAALKDIYGAAAWGDYDNDGDLDILLSGAYGANVSFTDVYRNNGDGTFTALNLGLRPLQGGAAAWGDFDSDGDLDLLLAGYNETDAAEYTRLYRNNAGTVNSPPSAPSGLSVVRAGNSPGAQFSWNTAADSETPAAGLSYNLRVGTSSGDDNVVAALANLTAGYRRVAALGNSQMREEYFLKDLVVNVTYYWSVEAVDAAWTGGAWAGEGSFRLSDFPAVTTLAVTKLTTTSAQCSGSATGTGITQKGLVWGQRPWPTVANCLGSSQHGAGAGSFSDTMSGLTAGVTYYVRAYAVNGGGTGYGDQHSFVLSAAPFAELDPGFRAGGWYARAAWGDYDNDGDLDLFLAGYDDGATPKAAARIYRNNGDGTFTDLNAGLPNVEFGTWGDFDRDGDLDLAVSGLDYETNTRVTEIYRNDNGSFVSINAGLTPVEYAELAWGDYDNDGDLDLVVAGDDATGAQRTTLYRNDGGVFVDANAGLLGVDSASLAWGDYDNDGDLDLALSGYTGPGESRARLYRNDGGAFVAMDAGLVQAGDGTVAWGDYDNDGDLDLLVSGSVGGATDATRLYRNNGNGTFTENAVAALKDIYGAAAWGDYDNDGDLDILLSGAYGANVSFTDVYRNNGDGTFTALNLGLRPLQGGAAVWGDYDNDGDLDLLLAGYNETDDAEYTRLYRNNIDIWNSPPAEPTGLLATFVAGGATLTWNVATDSQTPAKGLSYNLRVGTTPGAANVFSGMANLTTGQRCLPALGNVNQNRTWTLTLPQGATYYWSAQAVDTAFAGGAWAAEHSFSTSLTWASGGSYDWEINDATGTKGTGWDWLNILGDLTINATSQPPNDPTKQFTIAISGVGEHFDNTASNSWIVATASGAVNQFNANKFILTTGGFTPSLNGGSFSVVLQDKSVALVFTPQPPPCSATTSATAAVEGTVMVMTFVNDSKLGSVQALVKDNCTIVGKEYSDPATATNGGTAITGNIELNARTTLLDTTKKVVLWASKVASGLPAAVNVLAIDTCGRGASFDPVITTLEVTTGGQVEQRFAGILAAERYLRVINGSPGLTKLEVMLNGYTFRLDSLVAGQTVAADLGTAMHEGDANVVVLTGYGEAGASALVLLTDQPTSDLMPLTARAELALAPAGKQLVLTWPEALIGWELQSNASLPGDWQPVTPLPVAVDGRLTVTVGADRAAQFFRLHPVGQASRRSPSDHATLSPSAQPSGKSSNPTPQPFQRTYDGILW